MLPLFARCTQLWPTTKVAFLLCPLSRASAPRSLKSPYERGGFSSLRGPMPLNMKAFY